MIKHVIIAGSEKCGTTSLFQYLSDSKAFRSSRIKETDYFRSTGLTSLSGYEKFLEAGDKITLEASPGYLSESEIAADNILATLGRNNVYLIFCFRDPIDRLYSSFNFHKSRLYLDKSLSFDEFVDLCFKFEDGEYTPSDNVEQWCLSALKNGRFYNKLSPYLENFALDNMLFIHAKDLHVSPREQLLKIFTQISLEFPQHMYQYEFGVSNKTNSFKNDHIHRVALSANKLLESYFIKNPSIKKLLLKIYNLLNGKNFEAKKYSDITYLKLKDYYADDLKKLSELFVEKENIV